MSDDNRKTQVFTGCPKDPDWLNRSYPAREIPLDQIVKMLEAKRKQDEKRRQN